MNAVISHRLKMMAIEIDEVRDALSKLKSTPFDEATVMPAGYYTSDDFMRLEARRMARRALSDLAPEQRHVLELAFIEGLTQVEVAERTGLPLGTAKARIRRGVMSMRRRLPHRMAA